MKHETDDPLELFGLWTLTRHGEWLHCHGTLNADGFLIEVAVEGQAPHKSRTFRELGDAVAWVERERASNTSSGWTSNPALGQSPPADPPLSP